jgi:hypothetical protein
LIRCSPGTVLDDVNLEFHHTLLRAPSVSLPAYLREGMVVAAGRDAFLCSCTPPIINMSTNKLTLLIRANTWVDHDQLRVDQERSLDQLMKSADTVTFGSNWLLPDLLRPREVREISLGEGTT